jgi:hypothetical protein
MLWVSARASYTSSRQKREEPTAASAAMLTKLARTIRGKTFEM